MMSTTTNRKQAIRNIIIFAILVNMLAWRFRSTWMAIIVHSAQNVFFAFLVLGVVLGLA